MRYIIAGRCLCLFSYYLYILYLQNNESLQITESFLGWFLFEHVFEEYQVTPGKLFLINMDFKNFITNVMLIARNLFFIAQFFTPTEFLLIHSILIIFVIIYKKNLKSTAFKFVLFFIYINILNSFLFINIYNILSFLYYICGFYLVNICFCFYFILFYFLIFSKIGNYFGLKISVIKIFLYIVISLIFLYLWVFDLTVFISINGNFMQEFVIRYLILYLYFILYLS